MPQQPPVPFFLKRIDADIDARAAELFNQMDGGQKGALGVLDGELEEYYQDLKQVVLEQVRAILIEEGVDPQVEMDISMMASHIMLRAVTKFSLAMGEIMAYGKQQAPVEVESADN